MLWALMVMTDCTMAKFEYYLLQNNHDALFAKLKQIDPTERHLVKVKPYTEQRTDLQNRLSHGWYGELAEGIKEHDAIGYKCFCKLHFGVPIMRAEDDEFREVYDSAIKGLSNSFVDLIRSNASFVFFRSMRFSVASLAILFCFDLLA